MWFRIKKSVNLNYEPEHTDLVSDGPFISGKVETSRTVEGQVKYYEATIKSNGENGVYLDGLFTTEYSECPYNMYYTTVNFTKINEDNSIAVRSYSDYYPFGHIMRKYQPSKPYRFGYQGQFAEDETEETGYNSFEAREYDSKIGRWNTTDPAGQYFSPYLAFGNNPINKVDPDGKKDIVFNSDGSFNSVQNDKFWHNLWFGTRGVVNDNSGIKASTFRFNDVGDADRFLLGSSDPNFLSGIDMNFLPNNLNSIVDRGTSPANGLGLIDKYKYIYNESMGGGNLDYCCRDFRGDKLYFMNGLAYNNFDAGNFVWGRALAVMNVPWTFVKGGSEYNGFWNGKMQNGEWAPGQPTLNRITWKGDAAADQRAILNGYNHPYFINH